MSWSDYIRLILGVNTCESAAIVSVETGMAWDCSPGFTLSKYTMEIEKERGVKKQIEVDEGKLLKELFENKGVITSTPLGMIMNKMKFTVAHWDEENSLVYLKKFWGGAVIIKTNRTFCIGIYTQEKKQTPSECKKAVEFIANFLRKSGF